jgi:hypothetical protein
MALFGNPMDRSWSSSKRTSFFFYVIFLLASVWASGESLARTLETSRILCYVLAFAALSTASFCLNLLKQSRSRGQIENRSSKSFFGGVGFIFLWFCILMANTHNIYYTMTINKLRQKELRNIGNQLELLKNNSNSAFGSAKDRYSNDVDVFISNVRTELVHDENPGRGDSTDRLMRRGIPLVGDIRLPSNPPRDKAGLRIYADKVANSIEQSKRLRLNAIDSKISELDKFLNEKDFTTTQKNIEEIIKNYESTDEKEIVKGLRNSYSTYAKAQDYLKKLFSDKFLKDNTHLDIKELPEIPESIDLDDIAYSWGSFFDGKLNTSRFWWSIVIALVLDLACFLFWYFGVLQDED